MRTFLIAATLVGLACPVFAQQPDTENGRYTLSPIDGGFVRLDTRNGMVSTCSEGASGWACTITPDERATYDAEIGRLQAETEQLRAKLAERDTSQGKIEDALPKTDPLTPLPKTAEGGRKLEIPLPSDQDIDRAASFVEQAWRRLVELVTRVQRDVGGKI